MIFDTSLNEFSNDEIHHCCNLGYIVWTGTRTNAGTLGLQFIVQGPKDPDHVLERIEAFLEQSRVGVLFHVCNL